MTTHDLKTHPEFFAAVDAGWKTFEIRLNDRDYQVGDMLKLREWNPTSQEYTGRYAFRRVTYITTDSRFVPEGYCAMGMIKPIMHREVIKSRINDRLQKEGCVVRFDRWGQLEEDIIRLVEKDIG